MKKEYIGLIIGIIIILAIALCAYNLNNTPVSSGDNIIYINENYYDDTAVGFGGMLEEGQSVDDLLNSLGVPKAEGELKVYFFDVGQAESIFVQNGDSCMLIDAGNNPDGKYVSKYLRNTLGIKKIDYLIGTHAHEDHIGGTDIILEDFEISNFYMPEKGADSKAYTDVVSWAKKKNVDIKSPGVGTKFNVGAASCEIMTQDNSSEDLNETSIVVELTFGNQKFLFTGDIEASKEESRMWNDIDVLKVAHHGSVYASTEEFLKQVKPEVAIISCGKDNDYYYPHEKVLERLKNVGCKELYTTAENGTILITSDGNANKIEFLDLSLDGNK